MSGGETWQGSNWDMVDYTAPGVVYCFRASIPSNPTTAVRAHKPPLWRGEAFAVLQGVESVRPAGECCVVICVAELVVLPYVKTCENNSNADPDYSEKNVVPRPTICSVGGFSMDVVFYR